MERIECRHVMPPGLLLSTLPAEPSKRFGTICSEVTETLDRLCNYESMFSTPEMTQLISSSTRLYCVCSSSPELFGANLGLRAIEALGGLYTQAELVTTVLDRKSRFCRRDFCVVFALAGIDEQLTEAIASIKSQGGRYFVVTGYMYPIPEHIRSHADGTCAMRVAPDTVVPVAGLLLLAIASAICDNKEQIQQHRMDLKKLYHWVQTAGLRCRCEAKGPISTESTNSTVSDLMSHLAIAASRGSADPLSDCPGPSRGFGLPPSGIPRRRPDLVDVCLWRPLATTNSLRHWREGDAVYFYLYGRGSNANLIDYVALELST
eukprot:Rmarinus@m.16659